MKPAPPSNTLPSTLLVLQPNYIHVSHAREEAVLVHYSLGQGERRLLIIAGVHGREHGGIQAAYDLLVQLENIPLQCQVDIIPICNPMAYAAETRFTPGTDRDMARAFTLDQPICLTEALSQAVLRLAEKADLVLNLHSAGDARYLPHVIFYRENDVDNVASMGFPFAIKRGTPETLAKHIASFMRPEQLTVTLELGGGTFALPEDVASGVALTLAYLGRTGYVGSVNNTHEPTPRERIWLSDTRQFVRAPNEGAFYTHAQLGADITCGQPFGYWVGLEDLQLRQLLAPVTGKLIYLRTRNRVPQGETLAMFLPPNGTVEKKRFKDE